MSNVLRTSLIGDIVSPMTTTQHREIVAGEVRAALARDGRSAADLAEATGIARSSLSRKLRARTPFYVEELIEVAVALHIDPATLIPHLTEQRAA